MIIYDPEITGSFRINGQTLDSLSTIDSISGSVAVLENKTLVSESAQVVSLIEGQNVTLGNLTVNGTQTVIDSTTLDIGDNIIQLNTGGAVNGGLLIKDVTAPNTVSGSLLWDTTNDYWIAGQLGSESKILLQSGDNVAFTNTNNNFSAGQTITGNTTINGDLLISTNDSSRLSLETTDTTVTTGNLLGEIVFQGSDADLSTGNNIGAIIKAVGGSGWTVDPWDAPTNLEFYVQSNNGASNGLTDPAMVILNSKNVGIGTSNPSAKLDVDGKAIVGSDASNALEIFSNGDTEIGFSYATKGNIYAKIIGDITQASPLGGEVAFQTATGGTLTERMRIHSDGNIVLGANGNQYGLVTIRQSGTSNDSGLAVVNSGNTRSVRLWTDGTNSYLSSGATGNGVLVLNEGGGNVGIGTPSPFTNLTIAGAVDSRIALVNPTTGTTSSDGFVLICQSDTGVHFLNRENSEMRFSNNNTERMRITSSGNVGIGTSEPDFSLDVNGNIGVTGFSQVFAKRGTNVGTNPTLTLTLKSDTDSVGAIYCLDLIVSFGTSVGTNPSSAKIVYMFTTSRTSGVTTISNITNMDTITAGSITSISTNTSGNTISFVFNGAEGARVSAQGRIVYGNARVFVGFLSADWS